MPDTTAKSSTPNVFELIGNQLRMQGQAGIAIQSICAALLSEVCLLHPDPAAALDRISARLLGTAMGISDKFAQVTPDPGRDTAGITNTIEFVTVLAEDQIAMIDVKPSLWQHNSGAKFR
jgi:hypothetical protein